MSKNNLALTGEGSLIFQEAFMKKLFITFGGVILITSFAFAAQLHEGEKKEFSGIIEKDDWSKSMDSYCHSGSGYYVLVTADNRYPLDSERDTKRTTFEQRMDDNAALFKGSVGKNVFVEGQLIDATFSQQERCPHQGGQCISSDLSCTWLRVWNIKAKE